MNGHTQGFAAGRTLLLLLLLLTGAARADSTVSGVAFHLDSNADGNLALRRIAMQLQTFPEVPIRVVLIGSGVRISMEGATDAHGGLYSAQLEQLLAEGVRIFACENTMDSIDITADDLAFGIETVRSGIAELSSLQLQQQFAYIKL
jgi:intracellular sulfur oxidation DsrE/DsrF family protein